ncbi:procathepsin L-like isoform X1 [Tribolium castaneum]|uniref:procathepsin L-like isoform X1 n=1 Tax=Tribolium castaneum TaxID=7070 RepID=UPI00077D9499|nr:PREDICTED: cathepsin L1-like [Tribolium castaneum]|eukprot:XP_015836748.1 PREDICTED: cathepsin L1-like [Tribolium castaneum]
MGHKTEITFCPAKVSSEVASNKMWVLIHFLTVLYLSNSLSLNNEWEKFKRKYEKNYPNAHEENFRKSIFTKTLQEVTSHNARYWKGLEKYFVEINKFSDYMEDEMFCCPYDLARKPPNPSIVIFPNMSARPQSDLPDMVDWRLQGVVTPVKRQGKCGSCWAFAILGATEAHYRKQRGSFVILSEQQLVDCVREVGTCKGVWLDEVYEYIINSNGINYDQDYRYESAPGSCRFKPNKPTVTFKKYAYLAEISEEDLQWIVAKIGPATVSFDARGSQLKSYSGGIYYNRTCTKTLTHVAVVVGYGTEKGEDYWIVKNSWGPQWGIDGYVKMARNRNNHCGIARKVTYPIFD